METKHTPGPWRTDEAEHDMPYQHIRIYDGIFHVCTVPIDDAPVYDYNAAQRANASLIAAAPDLLAALKAFAACRVMATDGLPSGWSIAAGDGRMTLVRAEEIARAAIAKAEGRSEVRHTSNKETPA